MQPTENAAVQVRLSGAEFHSLENWRKAQKKIPHARRPSGRPSVGWYAPRTTDPSFPLATTNNAIQRRPKAYGPVASRTVCKPRRSQSATIGSKCDISKYNARTEPATLNYGNEPTRGRFPAGQARASACRAGAERLDTPESSRSTQTRARS